MSIFFGISQEVWMSERMNEISQGHNYLQISPKAQFKMNVEFTCQAEKHLENVKGK